jgi:hypothetical protein
MKERYAKVFTKKEWKNIIKGEFHNAPRFEVQASLRQGIPDELRP